MMQENECTVLFTACKKKLANFLLEKNQSFSFLLYT